MFVATWLSGVPPVRMVSTCEGGMSTLPHSMHAGNRSNGRIMSVIDRSAFIGSWRSSKGGLFHGVIVGGRLAVGAVGMHDYDKVAQKPVGVN